ncbi:MAG: YfhO family protein [Deltaproteobacteria bacterium]|nr:YfhO family protein [Deltaproteobacteria bacterium]
MVLDHRSIRRSIVFFMLAACSVFLVHHRFWTRCDYKYGDDDLEYHVPYAGFVLNSIESGQTPLWNPYTDMGTPIFCSTPFMGPFYPGFALFWFLKPCIALNLGYLFHALLACLGMFLLVKRLGLSDAAAAAAAMVFSGTSYFIAMGNQGYLSNFISSSYLPWIVLILIIGMSASRPIVFSLLAGIPVCLAILGGNTVRTAMTFFVAFVFLMAFPGGKIKRSYRLFMFLLSCISGFLAAAVWTFPVSAELYYNAIDKRGPVQAAYSKITTLLSYFAPFDAPGKLEAPFMGIVMILLLVVSISRENKKIWWAGIITSTISAIVATSPASGLQTLFLRLPYVSSIFRYPYIFRLGIVFGFTVAGATSIDHVLLMARQSELSRSHSLFFRTVVTAVIFSLLSALAVLTGSSNISGSATIFRNIAWIFSFTGLAALSMLGIASGKSESITRWLLGTIILETLVFSIMATEPASRRFSIGNYYKGGWIQAAILDEAGKPGNITGRGHYHIGGRLLVFQVRTPEKDWAWRRNESMLRNIPVANSEVKLVRTELYEVSKKLAGLSLLRDDIFTAAQGGPDPENLKKGPVHLEQGSINDKILNLTSVRYLLLDKDRKVEGKGVKLVAHDNNASLWVRKNSLAQFRITFYCRSLQQGSALDSTLGENLDISNTVVIEGAACRTKKIPELAKKVHEAHLAIKESGNGRSLLYLEMPAAGYLVLSRIYHPGWHALIDGEQVPLLKAYGFLQAVYVPKGNHKVLMEFSSFPFELGAIVSITWLLVLALMAFTFRKAFPR